MISLGGDEHLGLVGKPSKGLGVQDPVSISLKSGPVRVVGFRDLTPARFSYALHVTNRISISMTPGRSMTQAVERVQLAEAKGYETAWVIQVADREATVVAAAYALATSKIGIGTGVLPTYPRTPVVAAQTAATLDELSNGRFILGLGTSHRLTIEHWHGMALSRPLRSIEEYVGAVRSIFRGETFSGEIYKTAFSFMGYEPVRRDPPIYISCLSPKMCELAGRIADGAVLWMCAPRYIEQTVIPAIEQGRRSVGKTMEGFEVVAAVPTALTQDAAAGRNAFRATASVYWSLPFYRAAVEGAGLSDALATFDREGPSGIPDEAVDLYAGIGDSHECRKAIAAYRSAGVTLPSVAPLPRHEGGAATEDLLEQLAPVTF